MTQAAVMTHPWKATQHRGFIEKVVLEGQSEVDGRTWVAQIRSDAESRGEPLASFAIEVNTTEEPGNIVLYFTLTGTETALLPASAEWDVEERYGDDTPSQPLLKGTIETAKAVTRPDVP